MPSDARLLQEGSIVRKVIAGLFISLDGVVEAPDQWHFPYFNDEMGAAVDATLGSADTVLFGRKTYDSFAGAWPAREAAGEEDAGHRRSANAARRARVGTARSRRKGRALERSGADR
jgi:dihydrofolate reductase